MEPSATSTLVTGTVGERFQVGTEDASVLDRPEPLRRLHDSGAGYKYPDLLTYLLLTRMVWLPEGEKLLNIHVLVSAEYTNVTDGRTDGRTDTARRLRASRGKNGHNFCRIEQVGSCMKYLSGYLR